MNTIPIMIVYQGMLLKGNAKPLETSNEVTPSSLRIYIQGWCLGTLSYSENKWIMDQPIDPNFIESLGRYIYSYIESIRKAMNHH